MKKWSVLLLSLLLFIPTRAFAERDVHLFMHSNYVYGDVAPRIENNRVLVPLRLIGEETGCNVQWIQSERKIRITKYSYPSDRVIELTLDSNVAHVSEDYFNKTVRMDVAPKIVDNRTLVPIRFISETFEEKVTWDEANRTVAIGEAYYPPRDFKLLDVHFGDRNFKVHSFVAGDRRMISLKDFAAAMQWPYSFKRGVLGPFEDALTISLEEPSTGKIVTIDDYAGVQCDGFDIYSFHSEARIYPYLLLDGDHYLSVNELMSALHWNFSEEGGDLFLGENNENTRYAVYYNFSDENSNYSRVPSDINWVEYRNNHYYLMPLNKTVDQYWDSEYSFGEDDAHFFGMNNFMLDQETQSVDLMIAG
ncbi:MAG: copper amine oxidase N-terminal domain-containing protein [Peptoniphilus sp.]|nr:copper amine oxidase N-terminal domain-containing protein [Peptoniphilus sp.]MDD7363647.1 copper amine oxidase N-terminal domain-containing protein [Bacillota bacterium]MDY6044707.1 copper amine oxidase N-terminal domain-containing protein [Peptoniphilus sp.]